MTKQETLSLLLSDHFLPKIEATAILTQAFHWSPGYALICIRTDFINENVHKVLNSSVEAHKAAYLLEYSQNEFIIVLDNSPDPERCIRIAAEIRAGLLKITNTVFSIGISRMRNNASELFACRKEAERACSATHMFGQNSIIHINYLDSNDIEYIYPAHKEKKLIEATMDGDIAYAMQMLDEIFAVFKSCENLKQSLINKMVLKILVGLNIAASSRATAFEKMEFDSLSLKTLMAAETVEEAHAFLKKGIHDFAKEMNELTDVARDALFYKLSGAKETAGSVEELVQKLGTTLCFINTAIYKNNKSNIFSFLDE